MLVKLAASYLKLNVLTTTDEGVGVVVLVGVGVVPPEEDCVIVGVFVGVTVLVGVGVVVPDGVLVTELVGVLVGVIVEVIVFVGVLV
jgi:hypothetical protein